MKSQEFHQSKRLQRWFCLNSVLIKYVVTVFWLCTAVHSLKVVPVLLTFRSQLYEDEFIIPHKHQPGYCTPEAGVRKLMDISRHLSIALITHGMHLFLVELLIFMKSLLPWNASHDRMQIWVFLHLLFFSMAEDSDSWPGSHCQASCCPLLPVFMLS